MRIERAIESIRTLPSPGGWVRVEQVRKTPGRLELCLGVHMEDRGRRKIGAWRVICLGVREAHIVDFDGGGLAIYPTTHPAARQYAARQAEVRWVAHAD